MFTVTLHLKGAKPEDRELSRVYINDDLRERYQTLTRVSATNTTLDMAYLNAISKGFETMEGLLNLKVFRLIYDKVEIIDHSEERHDEW